MTGLALKHIVLAGLLLLALTTVVSAVDQNFRDNKINLDSSGLTVSGKTSVDLSNGELNFIEHESGISVKTRMKVNGEDFTPDVSVTDNGEMKFARSAQEPKSMSGKQQNLGLKTEQPLEQVGGITPDITATYVYTGNTIKETIVLQNDMDLSFPVTIPEGQKMIHIKPDNWKIVNATNGNTMVGMLAETPFGVDAAGRNISMNYTWDGSELHLNYERLILVVDYEARTQEYVDITYPLTIDPTWTYETDHWITTYSSGGKNYTVVKWNVSGTTTWTFPEVGHSFTLNYLIIGGGGAGGTNTTMYAQSAGGGGAGSFFNNTESMSNNSEITITVGAGGYGQYGNGEASSITVTGGGYREAIGGGHGGEATVDIAPERCIYPDSGGSGGGGLNGQYCSNAPGIALNSSRGHNGGAGYAGSGVSGQSGGGGGAGAVGMAGFSVSGGDGGAGKYNSITGDSIQYACGGGAWTLAYGYAYEGCSGAGHPAIDGFGHGGSAVNWGYPSTHGGSGVIIFRYETPNQTEASFYVNGYDGYAPDQVQFVDTSKGFPTSWNWSYTNVTPGNNTEIWWSTDHYPVVTFGMGNWLIKLNATGAGGSNVSQSQYVNESGAYVPPAPTASFEIVGYDDGIFPDEVRLYGTSTGSPNHWNWSYTNVTPGNNTEIWFTNQESPYVTFGSGNWLIKLNASNAGGSNISQSQYVNISPAPVPVAAFTTTGETGVAPYMIQFYDQSTNNPIGWRWSYTNVTPGNNTEIWFSTIKNPIVTFGNGSWLIRLNATNAGGSNISTQMTYISVSATGSPTPTPTPVEGGVGALSIGGFVKDAETTDVIINATVTILQGVINITVKTNETGYYLAQHQYLAPGSSITRVTSADGYETQVNTSTPLGIYGLLQLNETLLSEAPVYSDTLGGIVRLPPFNQTVDNAWVRIQNESYGEYYDVYTNSAGYYEQQPIYTRSGAGVKYQVWASKEGLVNSSVYNVTCYGGEYDS